MTGLRRGAVVLAAALALAAPARAESIDQLYQKAKAEGAVVLWAAGPTAGYEQAAKSFEARFPGVAVSLTGGFSNVLNAKVVAQLEAKKVETDVTVFQTVQDFVAWDRRGWLMRWKPDGYAAVRAGFKAKDGSWIAVNANPLVYGYNIDNVKPADLPKSALDFLKPEFAGKVVSAYPADDDATLFDFYTIVQKYGWGYMAKYMAQKPTFIQGHLSVARALGSGTAWVSFDNSIGSTENVKREGGRIGLAWPQKDPVPVFFVSEAILKGAPHPNAAKLYVTWMLSKEQQGKGGGYSSRTDVPPPAGLPDLNKLKLADRYLAFVTDRAQLVALRKRFESYSGPVTNTGGVK